MIAPKNRLINIMKVGFEVREAPPNLCLSVNESRCRHYDHKRVGQVGEFRDGAEVYTFGDFSR